MSGVTASPVVNPAAAAVANPNPPAPNAGRPAVVSTEQVSKWYGQVIGLNDVTVNVPPGITGLLGPNGAGKSTFMKLITGQLKPSKGTVKVLGEPIWGNPSLYFQIGFCPEQDSFYERMTGLEWVTALVRLERLRRKRRCGSGAYARWPASICSTRRTRRSAPTARACASA